MGSYAGLAALASVPDKDLPSLSYGERAGTSTPNGDPAGATDPAPRLLAGAPPEMGLSPEWRQVGSALRRMVQLQEQQQAAAPGTLQAIKTEEEQLMILARLGEQVEL